MKINEKELYDFAIGIRIFQIAPTWIDKGEISEIFTLINECMKIVNQMAELISFNYETDDIKAFGILVDKFKRVRDNHRLSNKLGLKDSAIRISIGEYLTNKLPSKKYKDFYEYVIIGEWF